MEGIDWKDILTRIKATNEFITCPNCKRFIYSDDREGPADLESTTFYCFKCNIPWKLKPKIEKDPKKNSPRKVTLEVIAKLVMEQGINAVNLVKMLVELKFMDQESIEELSRYLKKMSE